MTYPATQVEWPMWDVGYRLDPIRAIDCEPSFLWLLHHPQDTEVGHHWYIWNKSRPDPIPVRMPPGGGLWCDRCRTRYARV